MSRQMAEMQDATIKAQCKVLRMPMIASQFAIFPAERPGRFGIQPDIAKDFATQVCNRGEDAAIDDFALQFGEPDFDLVQPGRIGGCKVQAHVGVGVQKLAARCNFRYRSSNCRSKPTPPDHTCPTRWHPDLW